MEKKIVPIFVASVGAGVLLFFTKDLLLSTAQPFLVQAQTLFSRALTAWNALPEIVRGVVLLAIPTMAAVFFAWTKNRAMQKLNETQTAASQQAKQLSGEAQTAKQEALQLQAEKQRLETQIDNYGSQYSDFKAVSERAEEAELLVTQKQREIDSLKEQLASLNKLLVDFKAKESIIVK